MVKADLVLQLKLLEFAVKSKIVVRVAVGPFLKMFVRIEKWPFLSSFSIVDKLTI